MLTWCVQWLYNIINIPKCIFKMIEILPAARMLLRRTLLREHLHWRHLQGRHVADVWRHLTMKSTISVFKQVVSIWNGHAILQRSPLTGGLKDFLKVLLTWKPISGREINHFKYGLNNRLINIVKPCQTPLTCLDEGGGRGPAQDEREQLHLHRVRPDPQAAPASTLAHLSWLYNAAVVNINVISGVSGHSLTIYTSETPLNVKLKVWFALLSFTFFQ